MILLSLVPPAILAFVCLAYIFWSNAKFNAAPGQKTRLDHLRDRLEVVYDNLRDLNFEYRAGKYELSDYNLQRNSLEAEAENLLVQIDRLENFKNKLSPLSR